LGSLFHWKKRVRISTGVLSSGRALVLFVFSSGSQTDVCGLLRPSLSESPQIIIRHEKKNDDCHAQEAVCTNRLHEVGRIGSLGWRPVFCSA